MLQIVFNHFLVIVWHVKYPFVLFNEIRSSHNRGSIFSFLFFFYSVFAFFHHSWSQRPNWQWRFLSGNLESLLILRSPLYKGGFFLHPKGVHVFWYSYLFLINVNVDHKRPSDILLVCSCITRQVHIFSLGFWHLGWDSSGMQTWAAV